MDKQDIIAMARELGLPETEVDGVFRVNADDLGRFAALVEQRTHTKNKARWFQEGVEAEREACAKVAGWLWQQFYDTMDAHERLSSAPFRPSRFGFDQSTVQQSKRMMDAIRARSNT